MEALTLLLQRRSAPRLVAPAPQGEVLQNIFRAAIRVPDHGALQPWRFVTIQGAGLQRLSDLLYRCAVAEEMDEIGIEKAKNMPFQAPLIITVIAQCHPQSHIPQWEQIASACCSVMMMQMAAQAQGFNGIWRSGIWADHLQVRAAFNCSEQDKIVGFLYLGTPLLKSTVSSVLQDPGAFFSAF